MFEISVIIPTYNPGDYIEDCLNSIYRQNYPLNKFEIIIILNGDITKYKNKIVNIINNAPKELTVSLFTTTIEGVSNARNIGLTYAKGDYICFIDDDDIISPTYLSKLISKADNRTIVISNIYSFKNNIKEKAENFFVCPQLRNKDQYVNASLYKNRSFLAFPVAKIIHKDIISNRRFDVRFKNGEDALFITSLTDKIDKILFTDDDAIYYVRERNGSASRKKIPIGELTKTSIQLIHTYLKLYYHNFPKYNFLLFISRIPGVIKNAIHLFLNNK